MKKLLNLKFIFITAVIAGFAAFVIQDYFKNTYSKEIYIKKDMTIQRYYDSKIRSYPLEPSWEPTGIFGLETQPEIVGNVGLLVDISSGGMVYEKNSKEKIPIASLVKIMTAVVALEHRNLEEKILISETSASIGENSMGLTAGEAYTLEELMYGLILNSGNDAAVAIAENITGNTDTFVIWMNLKAEELGLQNTHFADPSGLNDETYSTAVDLVKLTRYALKNEDFKKIVSTVEVEFPYSDDHKYLYMYNQTNLLTTYPGVRGVKTGFTEDAGLCLVTYANNEGRELVGVVLNSTDRKGDMILMLDHGYDILGVSIEHNLLD